MWKTRDSIRHEPCTGVLVTPQFPGGRNFGTFFFLLINSVVIENSLSRKSSMSGLSRQSLSVAAFPCRAYTRTRAREPVVCKFGRTGACPLRRPVMTQFLCHDIRPSGLDHTLSRHRPRSRHKVKRDSIVIGKTFVTILVI